MMVDPPMPNLRPEFCSLSLAITEEYRGGQTCERSYLKSDMYQLILNLNHHDEEFALSQEKSAVLN